MTAPTFLRDHGRTLATSTADGLGRTVRTTDVFGRSSVTVYDALGRTSRGVANYQDGVYTPGVDGPDQDLITSSEYDVAGRRVASVTPAGLRTTYAYDSLNRLTGVTENAGGSVAPANVTTTYAYDQRGLLTGITDANAHTRTRSYNAAGWQTGATDALGRQVVTEYDRAGRRTAVYDLRPASVTYSYDNLDRLTGVNGSGGLVPSTFTYDLAARRTSMGDASGTTSYTYDGLDRATAVSHSVTGTVSQSFDLAGRRTALSTSTGMPALGFAYDDAGRLTEVQRAGVTLASATFDAGGRLANVSRANGLTTTNSYDNANRLTRLQTLQGGTPWSDFQYTVGRGGLVTGASESIGASSRSLTYTYDGLERLTQVVTTPGDTYAYTYDAVGNRLTVTVSGMLIENRTYDNADQVVGWSYDATGNLLSDGARTYGHDALNRLASTTSGGTTTTFLYTGDNALASRTVSGVTTTYTLDPAAGLTERLGSTTSGVSTWYSRGWGQELTRDTAGTLTYLLADRLGSIRAEADSAGTLTSSLNFDPYGTPQGTAPVDFGFTGEPQAEAGAGLVHLRARWYAPVSGAFVSRDAYQGETGSPRSQQPYGYALQAPTTWTDPSGFWIWRLASTWQHQDIERDYVSLGTGGFADAMYNPYLQAEYDDHRPYIPDLLISFPGFGDVYEIEPLREDALYSGHGEVAVKAAWLNQLAKQDRLKGWWQPKKSWGLPFLVAIPYDWNGIAWRAGIGFYYNGNLPRKIKHRNLPNAFLVAQSTPLEGVIAYWYEPNQKGKEARERLRSQVRASEQDLVRDVDYSTRGEQGSDESPGDVQPKPPVLPPLPFPPPIPVPGPRPNPGPAPALVSFDELGVFSSVWFYECFPATLWTTASEL